jgi:hypothetical protein
VVLEASVQIDASLAQLAILILLAFGGEGGAIAFDITAGIGEFGSRRGHDREEREESDVLQEELHDDEYEVKCGD